MTREALDTQGKPTTFIFWQMDIVSNCLLRLNLYAYRLVISQFILKKLFFVQWMGINKETESWGERRELIAIANSVLSGTPTSHLLLPYGSRNILIKWQKDCKNQGLYGSCMKLNLLDTTGLLYSWIHRSCGCLQKTKPVATSAWIAEDLMKTLLQAEKWASVGWGESVFYRKVAPGSLLIPSSLSAIHTWRAQIGLTLSLLPYLQQVWKERNQPFASHFSGTK